MNLFRLLFTFSFLWISLAFQAQSHVVTVCDSLSRKPIPFVTVAFDSSGFYADPYGEFPRELLPTDEFEIRCVGYIPKEIDSASVGDSIFLSPSQIELQEVIIKSEYEPFEIGYHEYESAKYAISGTNYILATLLNSNIQRKQKIEEIIIPFDRLRKGDQFKVFLFSVDEDGSPDKLIFSKNIIYEKRRNNFRLNLVDSNIILPAEGVIAGLTLAAQKEENPRGGGPSVLATTGVDETKTYQFTRNVWYPFDIYPDEIWNLKIGLKVRPF